MAPLVPRARRVSRLIALGAVGYAAVSGRRGSPGGSGSWTQQALMLGALTLGMPHGAADTELLRTAAHGSRRRHAGLIAGYALLATGATVVVRRGGPTVERGVLLASAAHFGEGELACWRPAPPGAAAARTTLRAAAAALATVGLPAAVGAANRLPPEVGATGALADPPSRIGRDRPGLTLLGDPAHRRTVAGPAGVTAATAAALALTGDREAAADTALLLALDLVAPPSLSFATYFGGWHALRHTARVVDALVADGELEPQESLLGSIVLLGRRSAWAAAVGLVAAGVLAAADPRRASDNAFAAVLGLTVPHMTTVALQLSRRPERWSAPSTS